MRKISTSKHLQVRIMQISQTFGKNLYFASGLTSLLVEKILLAKLCKWIKKLTSSPEVINKQNQNMHAQPGGQAKVKSSSSDVRFCRFFKLFVVNSCLVYCLLYSKSYWKLKRNDNDFSLSTHSLRTMVSVRKEVLYALVKKYVYLRKVILYAIFKGTFRMRKFKIS